MNTKTIFTLALCLSVLLFSSVASGQEKSENLFPTAIEYSQCGQFEQSNALCFQMLEKSKLSKKKKLEVYSLICQNYNLAGDYKRHYQYLSFTMSKKEFKKQVAWKLLSEQPGETMRRPNEDVSVEYTLDSCYYEGKFKGCNMLVPVTIGGKTERIMIDNGCAQYCVANETFVKSHGLRALDADVAIKGSAGASTSSRFAIADSLMIGRLTFYNVLFVVLPDEATKNPVKSFDAIIGANIYRLVGEMDFDNRSRTITFPYVQKDADPNLTINWVGHHYASVKIGSDTLTMMFDMGAATTVLSSLYYERYKDDVEKSGLKDTVRTVGIGGTKYEVGYKMPELKVQACGGEFTAHKVSVQTSSRGFAEEDFGLLGLDFLLSFERAELNIQKMYLQVY